jgi:hypothetical protein
MRITSGGNVGIGDSTTAISVVRLRVKGSDTTSSNYAFNTVDSSGSDLMWTRNDGLTYLKGNVLIGTTNTSSGQRLTVYSATETAQIRAAGAAPAILFTNTDTNTNSYSGYVGVATAVNNFVSGSVAGDMVIQNYSGYPILFGIGNVEKMRISSGGNVGFNNTSPQYYIDVAGTADQANFSSMLLRAGNSDDSTPESNQILFGYSNSANYAHGIKTRHQSGSAAGNSIEFWVWKFGDAIGTPAGQRVLVVEGSAVRIANGSGTLNTLSASERLNVNGTVYATGYYETSDIRLKNVLSTTDGNIPAITYTWKDGRDNKLHWGYAAQDVMKYLPDAVSGSEYYGLDYNQVHTYKIAIIEDEVTVLKRRVAELESKLN